MKWKKFSSKNVYKHERVTLNEDEIDRGKGKEKYPRIVFSDCTVILAVDKQDNVFLVKEYRNAIGGEVLNTPGGKIEEGETPLKAAKRELEEETGIKARKWTFQGVLNPVSAMVKCTHYMFLAQDLDFSKARENLKIVKMPFNELLEKVFSGEITDAATCVQAFKAEKLVKK